MNLMSILDPHTVAGLLKFHFREWRVSIVPRGKPLEEITSGVREKDVSTSRDTHLRVVVVCTCLIGHGVSILGTLAFLALQVRIHISINGDDYPTLPLYSLQPTEMLS